MKFKLGLLMAIATAGLITAGVACTSTEPAPSDNNLPRVTPDIQATLEALTRTELGAPTPTPVSPQAKAAAMQFASGHLAVSANWDRFHNEFDMWRGGLNACEASTVQVALNQFVGQFTDVTETARGISRPYVARRLADRLISAAQQEEEALRLLRDNWRQGVGMGVVLPTTAEAENGNAAEKTPDAARTVANPATVSAFETVDSARATASDIRKEVADALEDLRITTGPDSLAEVKDFSKSFRSIEQSWDSFNRDYDSLRNEEGQLSSQQTVDRLGSLVTRFRAIVVSIGNLPTLGVTRPVAETLAQSAEETDLAIRKLRGTSQKDEDSPGASAARVEPEQGGEGEESEESADAGRPPADFTTGDQDLFDEFDRQLVESDAARRQARQALADVLGHVSEQTQSALGAFTQEYELLLQKWDDFHEDYDAWRRSEGGCDRAEAVDKLAGFSVGFRQIVSDVRALPGAGFLRPLSEILVEAAESESEALQLLRDDWQPYDASVYKAIANTRNLSGRMRRQVSVGVQDLLDRYNISSSDLNR